MKKIYILALVLGAFSFSSNAQSEKFENFEGFDLGPVAPQSPDFRTWSGVDGGADDADVSDDEAFSGDKSLYISDNKLSDIIALAPSAPTSGVYTIEAWSYIPAGKSGYFNMQAALTAEGVAWTQALMGGNVYFNCKDDDTGNGGNTPGEGGVSGLIDCSAFDQVFTYPEDEWFKMTCVYDIDNENWDMYINDNPAVTDYPFEFGTQVFVELAGLDLYSSSTNNQQYFDDFDFFIGDKTLGVETFTTENFSVYPNPVRDVLNIKTTDAVDNVTVYDILGKVVLQENPGTISPAINTSSLPSGAYMVNVTIGNNSKTVKIIK